MIRELFLNYRSSCSTAHRRGSYWTRNVSPTCSGRHASKLRISKFRRSKLLQTKSPAYTQAGRGFQRRKVNLWLTPRSETPKASAILRYIFDALSYSFFSAQAPALGWPSRRRVRLLNSVPPALSNRYQGASGSSYKSSVDAKRARGWKLVPT